MNKTVKRITALSLILIMSICSIMSVNAATDDELLSKYDETTNYLSSLETPSVSSIGGEWMIIGLARAEKISDDFVNGYYENVVNYVSSNGSAKLHRAKSTENSRVIIALTSIGKDVTDVAGYNLLEPLADFNYLEKQGINGPIWALIAFDSLNYEIPVDSNASVQTTRGALVEYILNAHIENGGWSLTGLNTDPDMTGMAIQALAPYYDTNDYVKSAVDEALSALSDIQDENGGFASWGSVNAESCAQVITALTSLGVNPQTDERFIKNGNTLIDALMSFGVENGFAHIANSSYNQMATEQAYYSLVSYYRLVDNKTSLYDMSDLLNTPKKPNDINGDGVVNIVDCTCIQKYLVDLEEFSENQITDADYNGDGIVDIIDATSIQKYLVGII